MSKDNFHLMLPSFQQWIKMNLSENLKPFLHLPSVAPAASTQESAKHVVSTEDH